MRAVTTVVMFILLNALIASPQTWTFSRANVEYVIDLPSATWRVVPRVDLHEHVEFVNGNDEVNGYLRLSKILVHSETVPLTLFEHDEKWNLRRLPGYVVCGDCKGQEFRGHVSGAVFSYEYIKAGRTMAGRVYYLEVDKRTFYALRFTVAQHKLQSVKEQMDSIARSFRLK